MKKLFSALCALVLLALMNNALGEEYERADVTARLSELGFLSPSATDDADEALYYAVYNFQKANGIPATGSLDPTTEARVMSDEAVGYSEYLEHYCRPADTDLALGFHDSGKNVKNLQSTLASLGYYAGEASGEYTMETACAVALFEAVNGFEPDGYADRFVMGRLLSPSAIPLSGFEKKESLSFGDRGSNVKYAQRLLKNLGYFTGGVTGVFGENTQKAVLSFELHNGLEPTGVWHISYSVLAKNGRALDRQSALDADLSITLEPGNVSFRVADMKMRLAELGYYTGAQDDNYDERTRLAVMTFQEANGLPLTGVADGDTRALLYSENAVQMVSFGSLMDVCTLRYGQTSYGVYRMTRRLQRLGYPIETGWVYDDAVQEMVTVFKYAHGLEDGSFVNEETRRLMNSAEALTYAEALPIAREKQAQIEQANEYEAFIRSVRQTVGMPYEAGLTGPDKFGIGGFTYYCYSLLRVEIPPTAALQLEQAQTSGSLINDLSRLNGGAQVFFRDETQLYTGIVTEGRKLAYASPSQGKIVENDVDTVLATYEFVGLVVYFYAP